MKYGKNSEIPYNNPPITGPKILAVCQDKVLKATAWGKSFSLTIFAISEISAG